MALSITNKHASIQTADANNFSFGAFTVTAARWLIVDVFSLCGSAPNTPTLSGNGLTYTPETSQDVNTILRLTRFVVWTEAITSLTIAADFAGQTQGTCGLIANELTDADLSDPLTQSVKTGSLGTTYTATLAAYTGTTSRPLIGFVTAPNSVASVEGGYTSLNNTTAGDSAATMGSSWHPSTQDTTPSWTGTNRFHCVIASEVKEIEAAARTLRVLTSPLRW